MNIADQLKLFYRKFGEPQDNSKIVPAEALDRLNESRRTLAILLKYYNVKDYITAAGGETYWTMRDDFLGLYETARDCVTYDGEPVALKTLAEWATLTKDNSPLRSNARIGMLHGREFYLHPAAESGKEMKWWCYATPPDLPAITGGDAYLTDEQAMLMALDAAIKARGEYGESVPETMAMEYRELYKEIKRKAKPTGPRLENDPDK